MKKKNRKEKRKTNKKLLILVVISLLLLIFGLYIFRNNTNRVAFSVILATIPYGYDLLEIFNEDKFAKFGKLATPISIIVRLVVGTFIGVAASVVDIGKYLLEDIQA